MRLHAAFRGGLSRALHALRGPVSALAAILGLGGGHAQAEVPQRYEIEVQLDAQKHALQGRERIHFENHSDRPLSALLFHLYLNAFRDRQSVFMREGGSDLRGGALREPGRSEVTSLRTSQGADLLRGAERELIAGDFSQLRVQLPEALPPGAALDLDLTFEAQLPRIVARSGYAREFHLVGQWFPKLARLEPNGQFAGFAYHGFGEFYADFADFAYTVTVPAEYRIAASGERVSSEASGSAGAATRTERFVANDVHDVVWAAYPYFESYALQVGAVHVQLFAQRGYGPALRRQARVLRAALPYFQQRYGPYPYPALTVVIPPPFAARAAGMEYPRFFVSAGPWWALPRWAPDPLHDAVAAHEFAHQWFSGMVASDEVSYPVLDEGLAQWSCLDFLRHFYRTPPSLFAQRSPPFELFDVVRAMAVSRRERLPSSLLPAYEYKRRTLGPAVYERPSVVLERIAERFGRARLESALSSYARGQRFRHPTPPELFAAFDASFGPGFSERVLRPALEGREPPELAPRPAPDLQRLNGFDFLPELWLLAQGFLHGLGP